MAAARIFARAGYRAARVQDIAREAGYSVPSLYAYFPGKAPLYGAIMDRLRADFRAIFDQPVPRGLDLRQRVEALVHRQLALSVRWRDALNVFFSTDKPARPRRGPSGLAEHAGRIAAWMAAAEPCPFDRDELEELGWTLAGLMLVETRRWLETGSRTDLLARTPRLVDLFLGGALGTREGRT